MVFTPAFYSSRLKGQMQNCFENKVQKNKKNSSAPNEPNRKVNFSVEIVPKKNDWQETNPTL
ncbi:MAG: hypothetical protein IPM71_11795 [Bacteroidota bacterium]|nr:MAG: hypothetical protein IPM71_11795 [Bacteroidota bacterium]